MLNWSKNKVSEFGSNQDLEPTLLSALSIWRSTCQYDKSEDAFFCVFLCFSALYNKFSNPSDLIKQVIRVCAENVHEMHFAKGITLFFLPQITFF